MWVFIKNGECLFVLSDDEGGMGIYENHYCFNVGKVVLIVFNRWLLMACFIFYWRRVRII